MTIKAACITFPGSNCDQDIHRAVGLMGWDLQKVWHRDHVQGDVDVIFVPGGFSYGDYLRCGALARFSPAMESVHAHAQRGGLVMGICNGFQILCEAGLLPGALVRNEGLTFRCKWTHLAAENTSTAFTFACPPRMPLRIPVAHGEGRYVVDEAMLEEMRHNGQIVFRYVDATGDATDAANPNGSTANIAGVCNAAGNVLGMMPHPERAMEAILGGTDGLTIFRSIDHHLKMVATTH